MQKPQSKLLTQQITTNGGTVVSSLNDKNLQWVCNCNNNCSGDDKSEVKKSQCTDQNNTRKIVCLSDVARTTVKYLFALCVGITPATNTWVDACLSSKKLLQVADSASFFLPRGMSQQTKTVCPPLHPSSASIGEYVGLSPVASNKRVMFGMKLVLLGNPLFSQDWSVLAAAAGGEVTTFEAIVSLIDSIKNNSLNTGDNRSSIQNQVEAMKKVREVKATHVIICKSQTEALSDPAIADKLAEAMRCGLTVVSVDWMIETLVTQAKPPFDAYRL